MLDQLDAGNPFAEAVRDAQVKDLAESDPSTDLDGLDSARKLDILCRVAWGKAPDRLEVKGIRGLDPLNLAATREQSRRCRLIATANADRAAVVAPMDVYEADVLAQARGAENRIEIRTTDGSIYQIAGLGAGRWRSSTAILVDLIDAARTQANCVVPGRR